MPYASPINNVARPPEGTVPCWFIDPIELDQATKEKRKFYPYFIADEYFLIRSDDGERIEGYLGKLGYVPVFFDTIQPSITYFCNYFNRQSVYFSFDRISLYRLTGIIHQKPMVFTFKKINYTEMKQVEKLDLILRELHKYKHDGKYYSINGLTTQLAIPIANDTELKSLSHRLQNDGYIRGIFLRDDVSVSITSAGIDYCESDSYSYSGKAITSNFYHMNINNSPNANIVANSSNVNITITNYGGIKGLVSKIKETIGASEIYSKDQKKELSEGIIEIEQSVDAGKKPKFALSHFIHLAGSISEVGLLAIELGKLFSGS